MADHLAFGLRLRSAHPLPGLAEVGAQGDADVVIALDVQPPWAEVPEQERYRSDEREGDEPAPLVHKPGPDAAHQGRDAAGRNVYEEAEAANLMVLRAWAEEAL